jgi:hypothetical protein
MKKIILTLLCVTFSLALTADDKAKNSNNQASNKTENQDEIIIGFTKGDQTDIFAIPLDDDQLGQEEELDLFEKESKEYLEKKTQESSIKK